MFFVGVKRWQRLSAIWLLVVVRVIETPVWHGYLTVDIVGGRLVAALPRSMTRFTHHAVDLLLARLGRLLPRLPHEFGHVTATDRADTSTVPVWSGCRCTAGVPVRIVVAPLTPAKLQPTPSYISHY